MTSELLARVTEGPAPDAAGGHDMKRVDMKETR